MVSSSQSPSRARGPAPHRRSDGNRNHEAVLRAACEVFTEDGTTAPMEAVARRAGVGVATVYRHVHSRADLQRSVALVALRITRDVAVRATADGRDPATALRTFMEAMLERGVAGLVLALRTELDLGSDAELRAARDLAWAAVEDVVNGAKTAGALRPDVTSGDVGLLLARLGQPLPGPLDEQETAALAHRQLRLVLAGLAA